MSDETTNGKKPRAPRGSRKLSAAQLFDKIANLRETRAERRAAVIAEFEQGEIETEAGAVGRLEEGQAVRWAAMIPSLPNGDAAPAKSNGASTDAVPEALKQPLPAKRPGERTEVIRS